MRAESGRGWRTLAASARTRTSIHHEQEPPMAAVIAVGLCVAVFGLLNLIEYKRFD